jgi:hypothetical protein
MSEYKKKLEKAHHLDKYGLVDLLLACHNFLYNGQMFLCRIIAKKL